MKTAGKIAVLAAAMALAFVLTACGGGASSSSAASSASASSASASASSASTSASTSASASSASTSASASSAAAGAYQPGSISGDTYTSTFFGIQFKLPAGWKFKSEAEMAQMNQTVKDIMNSEDVTKALESGQIFYEMAAEADDQTSNVNAMVEYAGTPEAKALSASDYLAYTEQMLPSQLSAAGMTVKGSQLGSYTNGQTGDEFPALKATVEMKGVTLYEEMICVKSGDYFFSMTATALNEAELDSILCNLTKVK